MLIKEGPDVTGNHLAVFAKPTVRTGTVKGAVYVSGNLTNRIAGAVVRVSNGMKATTLDASGNYSGLGGPMGNGRAVPGYRVLAAIIEGPGGNIFVKFTGPQATVAAQQGAFAQMLGTFKAEK